MIPDILIEQNIKSVKHNMHINWNANDLNYLFKRYIIPLMDTEHAGDYTKEVMHILIKEF